MKHTIVIRRALACLMAALTAVGTFSAVGCSKKPAPERITDTVAGADTGTVTSDVTDRADDTEDGEDDVTEPVTDGEMSPVTEGETEPTGEPETEPLPPSVSLDLLTFTPASPEGQVLTEAGNSPQILIRNYNETATDALGRVLPTSAEAGLPKEGKYVGLFYSLWTVDTGAAIDNSKALAQNPLNPDYGSRWNFCFWSEPETGYHRADDVWQIKRDMYYFAMAGVDFLYFDMTNGYLYEEAMEVFLDTCLELRAQGIMTPYVVPWCFGTAIPGNGDTGKFYEMFMTQEKYKDMWFYWEGKPLALIKPLDDGSFPILDDENYADKLTFRKAWVSSGKYVKHYWEDNRVVNFGYGYGWDDDRKKAECIGIGCAGFANFGAGRSGALSAEHLLDQFYETPTMGEGLVFQDSFEQVMEKNPECEVLLISRWNEWIAQNFTHPDDKGTDTGFVDQFNAEFGRDIEPMKGGYTDNYFYQMCAIIRRFKGVLPADGNTGKQTVDVSGDFDQWQEILPLFTDFQGDTSHRDHSDTTGMRRYVNTTGRNDIVESRLTADGGMVYAYAKTDAPITDYEGSSNWMLLFIDADNNKSTGWEGYDFLINYAVLSDTTTTLCAYKDGVWQEVGVVNYQAKENQLMVAIPRSLLGLTGDSFTLNFHWMDNVTDIYSLEDWFTTGDSAPERRNNYTLTLSVAYDATEETLLPGRGAEAIGYMPAVSLTGDLSEGLLVERYWIVANYGKMPDFRLIDGNLQGKVSTTDVSSFDIQVDADSGVALSFEGYVWIPADGVYTFPVTADDCARLYVDGRLITEVAYDGARAANATATATGSIRLAKGYHRITVEYAEMGNGNATLTLGGEWDFYAEAADQGFYNIKMGTLTGVAGNPSVGSDVIEIRSYGTVLSMGEMDLSSCTAVEIYYGSDANAKLGDVGTYFALSSTADEIRSAEGHDGVLAKGYATNAQGGWSNDIRVATVDLSAVDYNGNVYLAAFMGDYNGVNIYAIRLIYGD